MIDGIESLYQSIGDAIVDSIPEEWDRAQIEVIFYDDNIEYYGEYWTPDGELKSFGVTTGAARAFRVMRSGFKDAGQAVWGQARFKISSDGKFKMDLGYDNCDQDGNTVWDENEYHRRHEERRRRLLEQ